ncbi:MAG: hypothetical protein CVU51_09395 [Deltaproteobacteria bacterium HGW-Deltaproteobacteria-1]|nr:MAG: hypothetical protein CVU51_09395 [Deltaproteobacteria bacterium HGW-Deltaproteobacteria-1]
MTGIGQKHKKAVNFIKQDVWRIQRKRLSPVRSFFLNLLRVVILSVRGFDEDKCQLRASALTFYSLISIVPILAMAFGVAKGFGFEKILEKQLREKLAGHEDILANVIQFSHSLLENTQGGLMAGVGVIMLFWAVLKVLGQVEDSFNDIWGVKKHRPLSRKFADYLSLMLICPVILIISGGVTVFVSTQVAMIMEKFTVLGSFRPVVFFLLAFFPYTLMWGLFTFLYVWNHYRNNLSGGSVVLHHVPGRCRKIQRHIRQFCSASTLFGMASTELADRPVWRGAFLCPPECGYL